MHHKSICCCCLPAWLLCDSSSTFSVPASLNPSPSLLCFAFLSWLLRDSSSFVRVQASLDPSPLLLCFGFSEKALVLLVFQLLWIRPHTFCAFVFLSCLLRDSSSCVRIPGCLGPSPTFVCFCLYVLAPMVQL